MTTKSGSIRLNITVPKEMLKTIEAHVIADTKEMMEEALIETANDIVYNLMRESDHTLTDLRQMGHPYGSKNPQFLHEPDYAIHEQTGELVSSFSGHDRHSIKPFRISQSSNWQHLKMWLSLDPDHAPLQTGSSHKPLAEILHEGNGFMRARPFLEVGGLQYLQDRRAMMGDE